MRGLDLRHLYFPILNKAKVFEEEFLIKMYKLKIDLVTLHLSTS
jgi:hypothetical protein